MEDIFKKHQEHWSNKDLALSSFAGILLLVVSLIFNYFTNGYASAHQSNFVSDIILDNIPTWHVGFLVVYGALAFMTFVIVLILINPKRLPFIVKSVALFVIIRAVFMTLTHIAPSPDRIILESSELLRFIGMNYSSDLFFSGHTGFPFLLALTFWKNEKLRITFILISILLASSVLLGHLHYSIDVFAAYFITHTIFYLSQRFFKRDYELLLKSL